MSVDEQIDQLNQARNLALSTPNFFPQVIRQILPICNNSDVRIQRWCSSFIREAFQSNESMLASNLKMDLSLDSLDSLITLLKVQDARVFKDCISIALIVYRLVFRFIVDNPQNTIAWIKICEVRELLISKYDTSYPYLSNNAESDSVNGTDVRIALIPFIVSVIEHQSTAAPSSKDPRVRSQSPATVGFSLSVVPPDHPLIKRSLEADALQLLEKLISKINTDILVPSIFTATLNQFVQLIKKRPQFIPRILKFIESYDTNNTSLSNYQSLDSYKLAKKFVDRSLKIFLNFLFRFNLVPSAAQPILSKKMEILVSRGEEIRRRNILAPSNDDKLIKKKELNGFYDCSTKLRSSDYKELYLLSDPKNELNSFDISSLPQNISITMTLTALRKADLNQLIKALNVVSQRYLYGLSHTLSDTTIKQETSVKDESSSATSSVPPSGASSTMQNNTSGNNYQVKDQKSSDRSTAIINANGSNGTNGNNGIGDIKSVTGAIDDDEDYNPETVYTLPPPKLISHEAKKKHVKLIIDNFFKLANNSNDKTFQNLPILNNNDNNDNSTESSDDTNPDLSKIAITNWKKDSWLVLLTRLATRGMKSIDSSNESENDNENGNEEEESKTDITKNNEELSDMIRTAIFEYFLNNIQSRIDLIIEWLNEEWYCEKITESNGNNYNKWTGKVLDSMIPFLEPNDRKIFIRLLSDLPYLDEELVMRLKSLCLDPVRSKIGFQSLQFLIMYRPPVKDICMAILENLKDNEDLKDDCESLLKKYCPEKYV